MLVREGMQVNHKRVYRLYREEGLAMSDSAATADPWKGAAARPAAIQAESAMVDRFCE